MSSLQLPSSLLHNIKMVIFDKDGTLIDVHHYWCSMIEFRANFFMKSFNGNKELYNELVDAMGINLKTKQMKPQGPVGIKPRRFIIQTVLKTLQKYDPFYTENKVEEIFQEVDDYSKEKLDEIVKLLPDVKRVIEELKSAKIKVVIATSDLTSRAKLAMQSLKIEYLFDDIIGADLVERAKPNPDLVEYLLLSHQLNHDEVVVVGDSMADLDMAQSANVKFIGLKTGLYTDDFIDKSENLINDLTQLKVEK